VTALKPVCFSVILSIAKNLYYRKNCGLELGSGRGESGVKEVEAEIIRTPNEVKNIRLPVIYWGNLVALFRSGENGI
jgi:hypothetical protein